MDRCRAKRLRLQTPPAHTTIAVTGATGYIGGRLVPRLLARGYRVRCLVRDPRKLASRSWANDPAIEIVTCDCGDPASLTEALRGCRAAYYLIHSMLVAGARYHQQDQALAQRFARAAASAGLERILYLGGLGELGDELSEHLRSRREVEQALASTAVPLTVFRAAMILGSGSASFEILRYLVERLPVMVTPRWVHTECQPIAVDNVLHYLTEALTVEATIGQTLDIGGPEVLSYRAILQQMARELGLRARLIVPVPVLTPRLSSWWIHLVTPISANIARPLAEGLRNRVVCRDDTAARLMPQRLLSVRDAIAAAVRGEGHGAAATSWSDAGVVPGDPDWAGGKVFVDRRERRVAAPPAAVFRAICRVGGGHGWYAADWLWRLRGLLDRLVGGPGLRRGRRDPERIGYGDALDFWRVRRCEQDRCLSLVAEMKLPGTATLEFELQPDAAGTVLVQTARFRPRGLFGLLYWYAVLPLHGIVFRGMLAGIDRTAKRIATAAVSSPVAAS